jgi:hypothetical protein
MTTYDGLEKFKEEIAKAAITMEMTHASFTTGTAESGFTLQWTTPDYPPVRNGPTGDMEFTSTDDKGASNTFVANPWEDVYKPWIDRIDEAFDGWLDIDDPGRSFEGSLTAVHDAINVLTFAPKEASEKAPPFTGQAELNSAMTEIALMHDNGVGQTVAAFRRFYGEPRLRTVIANQRNAMLALAAAMLTEQHVLKRLREDVVKIATNAKAAFEDTGPEPTPLTVVKAIGDIALGALPGLGSITSAIQKTVQVTGAVNSLLPPAPPSQGPVPLAGSNPDEVYSNLLRALGTLSSDLYDAEKAIHTGLIDGMLDEIYKQRDNFHVHHQLGLPEDVANLPPDSIDVFIGQMRAIGNYWLPWVADQFVKAMATMEPGAESQPWTRPAPVGGYGGGSSGPYQAWRELYDLLDTLATSSAAELFAAGPKLVAAAGGIEGADEDAYDTSKETEEKVNGAPYGWDPSAQTPEDARPPDVQNPSER